MIQEPPHPGNRDSYRFAPYTILILLGVIIVVTTIKTTTNSTQDFSSFASVDDIAEWKTYKEHFQKQYRSDEEDQLRFQIYLSNRKIIKEMNNEDSEFRGEHSTAYYELNQFSDLTSEEFEDSILTFGRTKTEDFGDSIFSPRDDELSRPFSNLKFIKKFRENKHLFINHRQLGIELSGEVPDWNETQCGACVRYSEMWDYNIDNLPTSFDWRNYGAVTPVKNQVYCGSCWSYSTTGDIEGTWYLSGHDLATFSEQQLIACDTMFNAGCDGGVTILAMQFTSRVGGLTTENLYPYKTVNMDNVDHSPVCDTDVVNHPKNLVGHIRYWQWISSGDLTVDQLKLALIRSGPLSIAVNAKGMEYYKSGIDDPSTCSADKLDHAVLLVGFGEEDGEDYWLIKNSWGTTWGEDGYYRITTSDNKCGVSSFVVHSIT